MSFDDLQKCCEVISSCKWTGGRERKKKLTKFTAEAFVITTINNIAASKHLLENCDFQYILPAIFSQDPLEKFFGQARQRCGGNFYIDIVDVMSAGKTQHVHQLVKYDIIPHGTADRNCSVCDLDIQETDIQLLHELSVEDTQNLLNSNDPLKHKVVYIGGFLVHKHGQPDVDEGEVSSEFLNELNRGGLSIPTLNTVFFVHCATSAHENIPEIRLKLHCRYFKKLLSYIDAPISQNGNACQTVTQRGHTRHHELNNSDSERELRMLETQGKAFKQHLA